MNEDLIERLEKRAEIRRQISTRKSVQEGKPDRIADLLEEAGVDTVPELAQRNPVNLLEKMQEANGQKKLVRRLPVLSQVESWVKQAKSLPRVIDY